MFIELIIEGEGVRLIPVYRITAISEKDKLRSHVQLDRKVSLSVMESYSSIKERLEKAGLTTHSVLVRKEN